MHRQNLSVVAHFLLTSGRTGLILVSPYPVIRFPPVLPKMAKDQLPEEVRRLISDHITSVEQLEILLLLRSRADIAWTASQVSEEIRSSERSTESRLRDLSVRGFAARQEEGGVESFRFNPRTEELRHAVTLLAKAYSERRYTIMELIFSKPIDNLRLYANAFRFRKDDSDG
jgi:hypothetical protein